MEPPAPLSPKRSQSEQHLQAARITSLLNSKSESTLKQDVPPEEDHVLKTSQNVASLQHLSHSPEKTPRAASCSSLLRFESGENVASSSVSPPRRASTHANPLRGDTNLKIFLPSDNLALKAILSPQNASNRRPNVEEATPHISSSTNLLDKLLFRNGTSAITTPIAPKKPVGCIVEEDVEALNNVVMSTNLPPPPFANMYACESCREDIGSLLSQGRHHCRNCGGSFCANCSTKSIIVPYQAYLTRGELRVCDGCYHRIQNFHQQVKSTSVTWSGLQPPSSEQLARAFELPKEESPVAIFNCALFSETTPYYGHLVLTRKRLCFQSYVDANKRIVAYAQILSLMKPQFYYINGLQVKTKEKEAFFLAEFNGLRDMCFLRLDQLVRACQEARKIRSFESPSSKELRKQALDRRRSYKRISEHLVSSCAKNSSHSLLSSSTPISTVGFIDGDDDDPNTEIPLSDLVDGHTDDGKSTASDEEPLEPLPPDPLLEKMTILLDCDLRADVKRVFDLLWNDGPGQEFSYATMEKARDIDIHIESWQAIDPSSKASELDKGFEISKEQDYTLSRIVRSQHPPKTSFPGLPPYAGCTRTQRFRLDKSSNGGEKWDRFVIAELNRMSKIPFSDYFEVEMRYVFSRDGNNYCHVQVGLVVNFLKATWFKSQINSSTRSESKEALEAWAKQSIEFLETQRNRVVQQSLPAFGSFSELDSEAGNVKHPLLKRESPDTRQNGDRLAAKLDTSSSSATQCAQFRLPPSVMSLLVAGLLVFGYILLREHQRQMQQLTDATIKLLEHIQEQQMLIQTQALKLQQTCDERC